MLTISEAAEQADKLHGTLADGDLEVALDRLAANNGFSREQLDTALEQLWASPEGNQEP